MKGLTVSARSAAAQLRGVYGLPITERTALQWVQAGWLMSVDDEVPASSSHRRRLSVERLEEWCQQVRVLTDDAVTQWPVETVWRMGLRPASAMNYVVTGQSAELGFMIAEGLPEQVAEAGLYGSWRLSEEAAEIMMATDSLFYGNLKGLTTPAMVRPIVDMKPSKDSQRGTYYQMVLGPTPQWWTQMYPADVYHHMGRGPVVQRLR